MSSIDKSSVRVKLVFSRTLYSQSAASVSMGSIAAYLRSLGFMADLCLLADSGLHDAEKILGASAGKRIVIAKPNFKDFRTVLPLLDHLKKVGSIERVFFCGPFAKRNIGSLMSELKWLDGVFMDQLESSAGNLLSTMNENLTVWDFRSPGSVSRDWSTGFIGTHVPLTRAIPLSDLPLPARDIETQEDVGFVNLEASRGCLFNCSFCHIPLMAETPTAAMPLNIRDPILVVDEIERLNRDLGKTLFIFNDSCFWSTENDDGRILRFCAEIKRRELDVRFYIYLKGEPFVGDEVLRALVNAGLVRVFLGIENSVKSTLAVYRKKVSPDLYTEARTKLDRLGVNIHIGYITIEPHSSLDDVLSNVSYLLRIGKLFRLGVITEPVRVVPGSELHVRLVREGLIRPDLPFDEVTYGYRFVHAEVGQLLGEWQKLLNGHLKDVAYAFEYHSTTGELLRVLAERMNQKFVDILDGPFAAFNTKKCRGMEILFRYLSSTIDFARAGKAYLAGDPAYQHEFVEEFTEIAGEVGALYAGIVSLVKQYGGKRAVREVYPG